MLAVLPVICQESIVGETFLHPKSGKTFVIPPAIPFVSGGRKTMLVKSVPRSRFMRPSIENRCCHVDFTTIFTVIYEFAPSCKVCASIYSRILY